MLRMAELRSPNPKELTPGMRQYWEVKRQFPDCIVLFRMGDFYETFYDDAKIVSRELQIVLTSRGKGNKKAPLAGIPHHALDTYLSKLISRGYKVAICEQLEDPKKAKGLVKRGVVRIVTPGTVFEQNLLGKENNYIMAIYPYKERYGISVSDFSTGEFYTTEVNSFADLDTEIERFLPREVILPEGTTDDKVISRLKELKIKPTYVEEYKFSPENARYLIKKHLDVEDPGGFGLQDKPLSLSSVGGLLSYIEYTQLGKPIKHIRKISYYSPKNDMIIDAITQRNLDLVRNQIDGTRRGTLLSILDKTVTPMGARTLTKWLLAPTRNLEVINRRLDAVGLLRDDPLFLDNLREELKGIYDLERIATRITLRSATPKDLIALKESLITVDRIDKLLNEKGKDILTRPNNLHKITDIIQLIDRSIVEDPPTLIREGGIIKDGYNPELDELRGMLRDTKTWITRLEEEERRRTGIPTLRVGYNKIIGYYIEVTKPYADKVPEDYIRKQTQLRTERFITHDLKEKEAQFLNAEERIKSLEYELFMNILNELDEYTGLIKDVSKWVGEIDTLHSLAHVSRMYNYVRPKVVEDDVIDIKNGRHPVVERSVENFVPNDVRLDTKERIMIITGPNMAGKSTIMRQVALITLMAHIGSYVPADKAVIGLTDRIFTRVGARDDLTRGQSTFMVEMIETANILNNATDRSLVILDEIGRGTSTYDGMSLAWAIAEYLATKIKCKTMFATHYHLLNLLAFKLDNVVNYNVAVDDTGEDIIFLHKLVRGGTDKSYGIHVARLAGLPKDVINRAIEIAQILEQNTKSDKDLLDQLKLFETNETRFEVRLETRNPEKEKKKITGQTTLFMFDD